MAPHKASNVMRKTAVGASERGRPAASARNTVIEAAPESNKLRKSFVDQLDVAILNDNASRDAAINIPGTAKGKATAVRRRAGPAAK